MPPNDTPEPGPNQKGINSKQGVVNERQGDINDEVLSALGDRQDASEATSTDLGERQDASEATAAEMTEQRDAEHVEQAGINTAQDEVNEAQAAINASAMKALVAVGEAAKDVTDLLRQNVSRGRRWTAALAVVIVVVALVSIVAFTDSARQRRLIRAQAIESCQADAKRTEHLKVELRFLVTTVGATSPDPNAKQFMANYPAHLERVIPPVEC